MSAQVQHILQVWGSFTPEHPPIRGKDTLLSLPLSLFLGRVLSKYRSNGYSRSPRQRRTSTLCNVPRAISRTSRVNRGMQRHSPKRNPYPGNLNHTGCSTRQLLGTRAIGKSMCRPHNIVVAGGQQMLKAYRCPTHSPPHHELWGLSCVRTTVGPRIPRLQGTAVSDCFVELRQGPPFFGGETR